MKLSFDRGYGVRLSLADVIVITVAAALTWVGYRHIGTLAYLLPFGVGHFFLFCNVFRLRRSLELAWGATFVVHLACWMLPAEGDPRTLLVWWILCAIQLPITAVVIVIELRSSRYHGVFAQRRRQTRLVRASLTARPSQPKPAAPA